MNTRLTFIFICLLTTIISSGQFQNHSNRHNNPIASKVNLLLKATELNTINNTKEQLDSNLYFLDSLSNIPLAKEAFLYDTLGRNIYKTWEEIDTLNKKWNLISETYFSYNDENRIISEEYHECYDTDILEPIYKYTYSYTITGKLKTESTYNYSSYFNYWVGNSKKQYNYQNDTLITKYKFNWNNDLNDWIKFNTTEYFNTDSGSYGIMISKNYDINGDGIVTTDDWHKIIYAFDEKSNLIKDQSLSWNTSNNDWTLKKEHNYAYNQNNSILMENSYIYESDTGPKVLVWDDEWIYDKNGNTTNYIFREKEEDSEEWYQQKTTYNYDLTQFATDYCLPYIDWMNIINKPTSIIGYVYLNNEWMQQYIAICYYSNGVTTNIDNSELIQIQSYNNTLTCYLPDSSKNSYLLIFDINGRQICKKPLSNNTTIHLDNLLKGIYIFQVYHSSKITSGKIRIQ